jgi:drug/metabolite transporter (DMT)-like permease
MSLEVFLMVLGAALLHATWNALVKSDGDRLTVIKLMFLTELVASLLLVPFVAAPPAASWPFIAASSIFNIGYMLFLHRAYQAGDLSLVYPLARGVAPLIVSVVSVSLLGEHLDRAGQIAILLITLGIMSIAITRGASGIREPRAVLLALATSGFIAGYTICDGLGARLAGSAISYMVWLTFPTSISIVCIVYFLQRGRSAPITRASRFAGVLSGLVSYASSMVVIFSLSLAPIALVSALRGTGIIFAVIIGVVFLNERLSLARLASVATTLIGITMLKFSR